MSKSEGPKIYYKEYESVPTVREVLDLLEKGEKLFQFRTKNPNSQSDEDFFLGFAKEEVFVGENVGNEGVIKEIRLERFGSDNLDTVITDYLRNLPQVEAEVERMEFVRMLGTIYIRVYGIVGLSIGTK